MFFLRFVVLGLLFQLTSSVLYGCTGQENSCGCSYRPVVTAKIVGGELAISHSWSWVVSLRYLDTHFCGGTILNDRFIITAAHCLSQKLPLLSNITVCAGIDYLSDVCSQSLSVTNVTIHHGFNYRTVDSDIALLQLSTPLNFSDRFIARICLPNATHSLDYPETGTSVITVGWGSTQIGGTATNELRQATLKILDKSSRMCASTTFSSSRQLCAYSPEKGMLS
jgi:secreted trypsin-like serine protease